jgi:Uma2 family endonuclease
MATASLLHKYEPPRPLPLENGDRLDQQTFHERYEAMPADVRAELIGGIVYMSSPQKKPHARTQGSLAWWLGAYEVATPGTQMLVNPTSILGPESEPEPDVSLIIEPQCGGQTREDDKGYVHGPAELNAEVSWTSESIDLHRKKADYEEAGVREYLVVALRLHQVFWFVRRRGRFRPLPPGEDGVLRSKVFPGLWLDAAALLRHDRKRMQAVLRQGLATPEHAAFVEKLAT